MTLGVTGIKFKAMERGWRSIRLLLYVFTVTNFPLNPVVDNELYVLRYHLRGTAVSLETNL